MYFAVKRLENPGKFRNYDFSNSANSGGVERNDCSKYISIDEEKNKI